MVSGGGGVFTHSSQPHAVNNNKNNKKKYRDVDIATWNGTNDQLNIMCDPRVIRGSTYSKHTSHSYNNTNNTTNGRMVPNNNNQQEEENIQQMTTKKSLRRRKVKSIYEFELPDYYQAGIDLSHILLEKENKHDIQSIDNLTQTDVFNILPEEENLLKLGTFIPMKTGIDNFTHMSDKENPFEFDIQVIPLLDTLVNKTIQQAIEEVTEEEELLALKIRMDDLYSAQQQEQERILKMEQDVTNVVQKKWEDVKRQQELYVEQNNMRGKVLAGTISRFIVKGMTDDIFVELSKQKSWSQLANENISTIFIPWLMGSVEEKIAHYDQAKGSLESLVVATVDKSNAMAKANREQIATAKAKAAEAIRLEALKSMIQIVIAGNIISEDAEDITIEVKVILDKEDYLVLIQKVKEYLSKMTDLGESAMGMEGLIIKYDDIELTEGSLLTSYNITPGAKVNASLV